MNNKIILDSDIISSIFSRKKINSKVIMPFKSFADDTRNYVLHKLALGEEEKPSVLSFVNFNHWYLITNERLVWEINQKWNYLYYEMIDSVDINQEGLFRLGSSFKSQTQEIDIKTKSGESILGDIGEAGASVFALLSVISWIVAKNKYS
ncbi:MAG: hypothetical protein V7L01_11755 [Nostoc sp.]|uniref:hypothetical protein n=1 Tax=Nostoc sp. TaxID=1180 RepID=UPI002FFB78F1